MKIHDLWQTKVPTVLWYRIDDGIAALGASLSSTWNRAAIYNVDTYHRSMYMW